MDSESASCTAPMAVKVWSSSVERYATSSPVPLTPCTSIIASYINPTNPNHLALANDGGLYTSYDKGKSWLHHNNIPTGEFYDIALSKEEPYKIYGGVQDDATVFGPAREYNPAYHKEWQYLWVDAWSGGDGCVTCIDPEDPNTVYFSMQNGAARRRDMTTGCSKSIRPRLPEDSEEKLEYNFITPYFISPHDHKTLYHGGNFVFKSTNRGDNWEMISPDLTKSKHNDKKSLSAGALVESTRKAGLLYMGTDRGAFWVTQNDGETWAEHSDGLANAYIRSIAPSQHKDARVYVAMTGINYDDLNAYLYASEDHGKTWKAIQNNLPNEPVNVILEDPWNENMLYAGGYRGVYVSQDRGMSWSLLGQNLPAASIGDLEIDQKSRDLVVGTHGRGIYKVNLHPLHKYLDSDQNAANLLPLPEFRRPWFRDTHKDPDYETLEKTAISFALPKAGKVTFNILNKANKVIWTKKLEGNQGLNQFRWDLILKKQESPQPYFIHYNVFITKGDYTLEMLYKGQKWTQKFEVKDYSK